MIAFRIARFIAVNSAQRPLHSIMELGESLAVSTFSEKPILNIQR
jgi:hypothetical protein